ncbi:unnamed protein product [Malus baccata var. baccata]
MMKRATMASFSTKPSKLYNVRSISMPVRSHPSTLRTEEELNKLKALEAALTSSSSPASSKADSICKALGGLKELYFCIEELLQLPLTQQALALHQKEKWVEELLDGSVTYLDVCGNTRDSILTMKESVRDLQSTLRRRKVGDSSIEDNVSSYVRIRKKMKKEIVQFMASLKQMDQKYEAFPLDIDNHLAAVVRVLREASLITSSIFHFLSSFLSTPILKPRPSRWSLVSILLHKGVLVSDNNQHKSMNELENVDIAISNMLVNNSGEGFEDDQKTQSAQRRLEVLDSSIEGIENGLECFKMQAKMAVARIKLLRNKRQVVVKQMRRDIALLLQSGQDATARIRVEHVIREQNVLAANEFIELFCELVVSRLSIIAKQRECPPDLKEGIASLIFASPRCSEIPELIALRNIFEKKYGKDFVSAAVDVRPSCGVNRMLIDKLSVRTPTGEVKLKLLKEIAKEYQVEWDTSESEQELLKPPEELIQGPRNFVSATSMPVQSVQPQSVETNKPDTSSSRRTSGGVERRTSGGGERRTSGGGERRTSSGGERGRMQFVDSASAAEAAAKSASEAMAAAQVAAYLANKDSNQAAQSSSSVNTGFGTPSGNSTGRFMPDSPSFGSQNMVNNGFGTPSGNSTGFFTPDSPSVGSQNSDHQSKAPGVDRSHSSRDEEAMHSHGNEKQFIYRRYSYNNAPSVHSDIKFDESDCDEEVEMESPPRGFHQAPERPPPQVPSTARQDSVPRVHPKLPDYDALAARFDALKYRKSS